MIRSRIYPERIGGAYTGRWVLACVCGTRRRLRARYAALLARNEHSRVCLGRGGRR